MAQQLIFTSTPQGLEPGRTGYCTVARHKDLRHRLVRELERLSVYDFGQQQGGNRVTISTFRKIILGSEEFYVLTKICDAGLDYTNRTNYLAHHLVLDGFEIATCPSPAEIFLNWKGWKSNWDEGPRYLSPGEEITLSGYKSSGLVPCKNWLSFTNDPGNAASLVSPGLVKPIVLENGPNQGEHLLQLFAESAALLKISLDAWDYSFTTFLQGNDDVKSFAWVGIEGQPAGERVKQGGLRNYIDLRAWTSSVISDEIDASLSHIARKGPTAPPTKRVKSGKNTSVTRPPLSDKQIQQIKGAASPHHSAAPSGSSVKAQETSNKKEKKKRPWILQLAVISTALCLLGALIVGLAYNLGDWFNQEVQDPKAEDVFSQSKSEQPAEPGKRTVLPGSFAEFDQVEYLKIAQKHPYLRWVSVDVGTKEPLKIKINNDQFDRFEKSLDQVEEGDELKVVITEKAGELVFSELEKAPPPKARGRGKEITFEEDETIAISEGENEVSFVLGNETFQYDLRRARNNEGARIKKLTELLQAGQKIPLKLRVVGTRVVHIEPFELPEDQANETLLDSKPKGPTDKPMVLAQVRGAGSAYFEPQQMRIQLPVNGTERIAYTFKPEEAAKIQALFEFLEKGEEGIDLDIRLSEDGEKITFLDFELPKEKPIAVKEDIPLSPVGLIPREKILFWIPGVKNNNQWRIDDSKNSFIYNDPETADCLLTFFRETSSNTLEPVVWMADYPKGELFSHDQFSDQSKIEEFTYEYNLSQHPLDPVKIANISFKSGKSYSFDLEITQGKSVEISYASDLARNSLDRGKIIRLPIFESSGESIDLLLLSNKHASLTEGVKIGQGYDLSRKEFEVQNKFISKQMFKFLSPGEGKLHFTLSCLPSSPHQSEVFFQPPNWQNFVDLRKAKLSGLPTALIQLSIDAPFLAGVELDLDYFRKISDQFLIEKQKCDERLNQLGAGFPNPEVYKNLETYAAGSKSQFAYQPGASFDSFAYNLPLSFIKKSFYSWDDVRFNNLRGEMEVVYNNPGLVSDPKLFSSYWTKLAEKVEKFISDSVQKDFNYQEEKAVRDVKLLFEFLELMLRTEMALGVEEENFLQDLQSIRSNLASPSPDQAFGQLYKEVLALSKANPKLSAYLKQYNENYREMQRKLVPSSKLNLSSLSLAIATISDPGKNAIYKKKESDIRRNQFWSEAYGEINLEILSKQEEIIKATSLQTAERFKKIISEIPWSLAVYEKNSNGDWVKQSDFLRLAPPANL